MQDNITLTSFGTGSLNLEHYAREAKIFSSDT